MMQAVLGGQEGGAFEALPAALPHVRAGTLRAIAVTGAKRSADPAQCADHRRGRSRRIRVLRRTGFVAPAATPRPIVDRLQAEIARIAASEEARSWFAANGAEPGIQTPQEFADFIHLEHARLGKLIHDAGLRAE